MRINNIQKIFFTITPPLNDVYIYIIQAGGVRFNKEEYMTFLAYFCAVMKCVIYGSTIFFTSKLTESIDVIDLLALRFLLSFVCMWLLKITGIWKINVGIKDVFKKNERTPFIKNLIQIHIREEQPT